MTAIVSPPLPALAESFQPEPSALMTRSRRLAFVDVETTGLDPIRSDLIEVAVLKVDPVTLAVEACLETRIRPPVSTVIEAKAAQLNGFRHADWVDAPDIETVLPRLSLFLDGCLVAGHNPAFDWSFLTMAFRRGALPPPDVGHHMVDTASLAWPLLRRGLVTSLSLRELCFHFHISNAGAHWHLPSPWGGAGGPWRRAYARPASQPDEGFRSDARRDR